MIAGALGLRAPAKTEEARRYERVVKERAGREREERRKGEEERERAIRDVWEG